MHEPLKHSCSSSVCVALPQAWEVISDPGAPAGGSGGHRSALGNPLAAHADREGAGYSRQQSRAPGEIHLTLPLHSTFLQLLRSSHFHPLHSNTYLPLRCL